MLSPFYILGELDLNIFYLDRDPKTCAEYHADKHVVKMILEYNQILCTTHRLLDGTRVLIGSKSPRYIMRDPNLEELLYKTTHQNHPSTVWVRKSAQHYNWLYNLMVSLLAEYTHRYGKTHACTKLVDALKHPPKNLQDNGWVDVSLAMPEEFKSVDHIESYRNYYKFGKADLLQFKNREKPEWLEIG